MKKPNHYACAYCSYDCPNSIFTESDYDVAMEMGYERIKCEKCNLNDGHCDTCLFEGSNKGMCDECDGRSEQNV